MTTRERWLKSWEALGAVPPCGVFDALIARYREPHRAYHTLHHLEECFEQLDLASQGAPPAPEVELALWFHDAVYDTRAMDNEERSAAWAREVLAEASVAEDRARRVTELILVTQHASGAQTPEQALLLDVDLSILGAERERFDEYERQIRREYCWVSEQEFRDTRSAILQSLLDRAHLYATPYFRQRLEQTARANLERSLKRLRSSEQL